MKEWVLRCLNHSLIGLTGTFTGREQLRVSALSMLAAAKVPLKAAQLPVLQH